MSRDSRPCTLSSWDPSTSDDGTLVSQQHDERVGVGRDHLDVMSGARSMKSATGPELSRRPRPMMIR